MISSLAFYILPLFTRDHKIARCRWEKANIY